MNEYLLNRPHHPLITHATDTVSEIVRLDPLGDSAWDARISVMPGATCFHSAGWMRVLHESYGYKPCCFASMGRPVLPAVSQPLVLKAFLPMMEVSSILTGRRGVALPFTDFCEAIGVAGCDIGPLVEHAVTHAHAHSWGHVDFRGSAGIPASAVASARHLAHRLDLGKGPDALWRGLDSAVRRSIRKARESGVVVSSGHDEAAMREFFRLHCLTRKRHGVPPQPYKFFSNIRRFLLEQGYGHILFAFDKRGKVLAAALFLYLGKHVIYKFGASDLACQHLRANHLVMWEAIERFSCGGMEELHMGRTETGHSGLRRYKLAWGVREEELHYHRYLPDGRGYVPGGNPGTGWSQQIIRRMPVPVSRMIGAMAYRHIG